MPDDEFLAELVALTREQLRWQRASVLPQVRRTIEEALSSTKLRRAFEMCDGRTASNDIAKSVGVSPQALSGWTRRWRDLGIAFEVDGRRVQHLTSLATLGLPTQLDDNSSAGRIKKQD
jgi:transposase-like protein